MGKIKICPRCNTKLKWDKDYKDYYCPECPKLLGVDRTEYTLERFLKEINKPLGEKIRRTKKIIKKYKRRSYVPWSGGKDSTLIAILAKQLVPKIPILFCDSTVEFPSNYEYMKKIVEKFQWENVFTVKRKGGFWGLPKGIVFGFRSSRWKERGCCTLLKIEQAQEWMKKHKVKTSFVGNRWDEAGTRWAHLFVNGIVDARFGMTRIFPIAWWNTEQVYEYFERYNIPLNPIYNEGWSRQGCYICPACPENQLKESYPELWKLREEAKIKYPTLYEHKEI